MDLDDCDLVLFRMRRERVITSPYSADVADDRESDSRLQGQSNLEEEEEEEDAMRRGRTVLCVAARTSRGRSYIRTY